MVTSTPAVDLNNCAERFCVEPTLMVPTLSAPGFCFVVLMKSASVEIGRAGFGDEDEVEIARGSIPGRNR